MRRAWKVSSGTAIAAASEVSLNSEMKVEPSAGSALRSMIGKRTSRATCRRVRPMERPASVRPAGMPMRLARNTSVR